MPEERVSVLLQSVDLGEVSARARPLPPAKPRRALILCNQTEGERVPRSGARGVRAGGRLARRLRAGRGPPVARPEELLAEYDMVFAKGRTALEALAVGASVIVYWWRRLGPVVTLEGLSV